MESHRKQTESVEDKIVAALDAAPDKFIGWTNFEDMVLRKYYPTKGCKVIANILKKSYSSVKSRASMLGIHVQRGKYHE